MKSNYVYPKFKVSDFNCPFCNEYAQQEWVDFYQYKENYKYKQELDGAVCKLCNKLSLWIDEKIVYPLVSGIPLPAKDMPEDIKKLYEEARSIESLSPRAAAGLLRVTLEELVTKYLDAQGDTLFNKIRYLERKGLSREVIDDCNTVRMFGNDGVHIGKIDLDSEDHREIVQKLFWLMNYIVEKTITETNRN